MGVPWLLLADPKQWGESHAGFGLGGYCVPFRTDRRPIRRQYDLARGGTQSVCPLCPGHPSWPHGVSAVFSGVLDLLFLGLM